MIDRLILPMLDVCVTCLREGMVADETDRRRRDDLRHRLCAVPRRADALRAQPRDADVRDTLERLAQIYGARFRPDPGWDSLQ